MFAGRVHYVKSIVIRSAIRNCHWFRLLCIVCVLFPCYKRLTQNTVWRNRCQINVVNIDILYSLVLYEELQVLKRNDVCRLYEVDNGHRESVIRERSGLPKNQNISSPNFFMTYLGRAIIWSYYAIKSDTMKVIFYEKMCYDFSRHCIKHNLKNWFMFISVRKIKL